MKLPKEIDGKFVCEICNARYKNLQALSKHIKLNHDELFYYNNFLKDENEGICKICGNATQKNLKLFSGYKNCCSKKCNKIYNLLRTQEEVENIYGVKNVFELKEIKDKIKQTIRKKYGVDYILQNPEIKEKANKKRKQTNKKRYGSENILNNFKKREETCIKKYGVKNPVQNKDIFDKIKNTNKKRYGVEFPNQNKEIFDKGFKMRVQTKQYKNTNITYQGSYELDFLEKYSNKISIENSPSIEYEFSGKHKVYHPDFYIPTLNLIVEIKNSYHYKKYYEHIMCKNNAVLAKGYNSIIIVDKHYKKFNQLLRNSADEQYEQNNKGIKPLF